MPRHAMPRDSCIKHEVKCGRRVVAVSPAYRTTDLKPVDHFPGHASEPHGRGNNMLTRRPIWILATFTSFIAVIVMAGASLVSARPQAPSSSSTPATSAGAPTERAPGLYWTMQTEMGAI